MSGNWLCPHYNNTVPVKINAKSFKLNIFFYQWVGQNRDMAQNAPNLFSRCLQDLSILESGFDLPPASSSLQMH